DGIAEGVVHFAFTTNPGGAPRTAHLTVLGQQVSVTQAGGQLGTTAVVEGPAAGSDSVVVAARRAWAATANASWLHTSSSGTGSGLATFTFDANPGATRSGTLTIAGQTLTVTQAGRTYVPVNPLTTLVSGLPTPSGVAVDGSGNVYIADSVNGVVREGNAATQTGSTLSARLTIP